MRYDAFADAAGEDLTTNEILGFFAKRMEAKDRAEASDRRQRARRTASCCGHCGDALPDQTGIFILRHGRRGLPVPICRRCLNGLSKAMAAARGVSVNDAARVLIDGPSSKITKEPCPGCGRIVIHRDWSGTTCSRRCAQRVEARSRRAPAWCPVCGRNFAAARKDAVYCSSACRQRTYRERRSVTAVPSVENAKEEP